MVRTARASKTAGGKIEAKPVHYELASPKLLSQQAADPVPRKPTEREDGNWNRLRSHLEQRLTNLRTWRSAWWITNWSDLAEFILPRRSIWLTQSAGGIPSPNNMTRGREINQSILDPTATFAARVCTGGLVSGLASQSRPWFSMVPANRKTELDAAGRAWIDETEERIYNVLALSNFYPSFTVKCEDVIVFGTAPRIIYEDATTVIHCYNPCVGEYYLANSGSNRTDVIYRQFLMTISQIVDFFGVDNCPLDVQSLWTEKGANLDQEKIICHAIEPNFGIDDGYGNKTVGIVPGNFTFREVYWIYGNAGSGPLSMRGFVDKPFTASLWSQQSNDAYGRSPGMDVLPDVLQLQVETARKAEAIEKMVRPPLVADATMKNQPSSSLPGHVTYVQKLSAESGMRPMYQVNPEIKEMMEDIAQIQARIKTGMYNDLFGLFQDMPQGKMTAYETAQRVNERLQIIGPVVENMLGDLKDELKRVYSIMKRRGLIDEPPDSLKGVPLSIEFVSLLAMAAKAQATGSIERLAAFVGNLSQEYPEVKYTYDAQESVREMGDLLGAPKKVIRGQQESSALQQADQQKQQQAQQMEAMQHGAQTAQIGAQAAQTLSQTQIGAGQNVLDRVISGAPSGGGQ